MYIHVHVNYLFLTEENCLCLRKFGKKMSLKIFKKNEIISLRKSLKKMCLYLSPPPPPNVYPSRKKIKKIKK